MNKELPFELPKYYKSDKKGFWKRQGMVFTEEDFEYIYNEFIYATNCDLCNKKFLKRHDRQLDHNHNTGEIRNILCNKCNNKRKDRKINSKNTSGYCGISKTKSNAKQGYSWRFVVTLDGKPKTIKRSIYFDKLVEFAEKWKKENNYYT